MGRNKGKITVEFATIDDLERIVKAMSLRGSTSRATSGLTGHRGLNVRKVKIVSGCGALLRSREPLNATVEFLTRRSERPDRRRYPKLDAGAGVPEQKIVDDHLLDSVYRLVSRPNRVSTRARLESCARQSA